MAQQHFDLSQIDEVTIVRFSDRRITDEVNIEEFGNELNELVAKGHRKLVLNFAHVEFLSSAALGKLISLDKRVRTAGGALKLSNIRPQIYEVFAITRLNEIFQIYETELEALEDF
jgi:anti-sigma B factor antagonist